MTVTVSRAEHRYGEFAEITLGADDDVVIDFRYDSASKAPSPNGERGIRLSVSAASSGAGVDGQISLGDSLTIDASTQVAAWATATQFWASETSGNHPRRSTGATGHRIYLSHRPSGDLRALATLEDAPRVGVKATLAEGFRKILEPLSLHDAASLALAPADFDLIETGDPLTLDATGGYTGITAGTTYYAIKNTGGSTYIKLATSPANAAAGTAVSITGSGDATDIRLDYPIIVSDGDGLSVQPEHPQADEITVGATSTASRLRLDGNAEIIGEGWDINIDIGGVSQVRRVASIDYEFAASGRTFDGFAYNAATKAFTAADAGDFRGIEGEDRVVVTDAGGYKGVAEGASYDIAIESGVSRTFKLTDPANSGAVVTLANISLAISAASVSENTLTTSSAADYALLKTGDRLDFTNNGGFEGINTANAYFLIKTSTDNVFKIATSRANAIAGTASAFSGSGTPANIAVQTGNISDFRLQQSRRSKYYDLNEAFTAAPPAGSRVRPVDGQHIGELEAIVETATAATTTLLPLKDYNSSISAAHDIDFKNEIRDIASVDATAKTVTLTNALDEAPEAGDLIEFAHRTEAFEAATEITVAAGGTKKFATIDYPIAALRFAGSGSGSNTSTVRIAACYIPSIRERN